MDMAYITWKRRNDEKKGKETEEQQEEDGRKQRKAQTSRTAQLNQTEHGDSTALRITKIR